ncbi:hypothetical protein J2X06_003064 [Lysobacter niastensis]|uniref:Lasso RiPP family leader peptide-containing protein n=1 Tax=Lysobacter niastensis TaxID=380629 RepID=A0ABU1WE21_9GAMM|nr:lasso RiPP family leader peptide-containing protein [Lysobacter niastensis]MDR7135846.1 hypothetical protein [Lysobacter niastensis]
MQDRDTDAISSTRPVTAETVRRPYATPALVDYGSVNTLTAGGSGHALENSNGDFKRA